MSCLFDLITEYGLLFVCGNVPSNRRVQPVPGYPTLALTGAMLGTEQYSVAALFITAVAKNLQPARYQPISASGPRRRHLSGEEVVSAAQLPARPAHGARFG
jgi:hypothetical protein